MPEVVFLLSTPTPKTEHLSFIIASPPSGDSVLDDGRDENDSLILPSMHRRESLGSKSSVTTPPPLPSTERERERQGKGRMKRRGRDNFCQVEFCRVPLLEDSGGPGLCALHLVQDTKRTRAVSSQLPFHS